jgi:hypothetical protein
MFVGFFHSSLFVYLYRPPSEREMSESTYYRSSKRMPTIISVLQKVALLTAYGMSSVVGSRYASLETRISHPSVRQPTAH